MLNVHESADEYVIEAEYTYPVQHCPRCGVMHPEVYGHGVKRQRIRDIPIHGKRVWVELHRRRLRCRSCGQTFMQEVHRLDERRAATHRLVTWMGDQSLRRTFVSVAEEVGVDEKTVRNIFHDLVAHLDEHQTFVTPEVLGIDEVMVFGNR